jgi:uncharacterized protein (TIGR02996 family)
VAKDDAFLQAIIESPDDDAPRLVYADWLEEHGQPDRAALIRVQCQLALLLDDDPRRRPLEAQERVLLDGHEREWVGPLGRLVKEWKFRRGFIEEVSVGAATFLAETRMLLRHAPIQSVRLKKGPFRRVDMAALAASPDLARLTVLDLQGTGLRPPDVQALVNSPYLVRLTKLSLGNNFNLGAAGARTLAQWPNLTRLTTLVLNDTVLGLRGLEALAGSPYASNLRELDLSGNGLTDFSVDPLVTSQYLAGLAGLDLTGNCFSDSGESRLFWRFGLTVYL